MAIVALALAARLTPWHEVFTARGIRLLIDTDPHYHVLRAERMLRGGATATWFDTRLDHPAGAPILWPPGFDAIVAATVRVVYGAATNRESVERVAVFVPVLIGLLGVLAQMAIARRLLGPLAALAAGGLAALHPLAVQYGGLAAVDQHIAEQLVLYALVAGVAVAGASGAMGGVLVAVGICAGPWIWQGAALGVGFVLVASLAIFVLEPDGSESTRCAIRSVAVGCAGGGALLGASMLAWGPPAPGRTDGLAGLSWVHPTAAVAVAVVLGALVRLSGVNALATRARRGLAGAFAAVLSIMMVLLVAPGAVAHGLRSLQASDPWLRTITEFQPVLFGRITSLRADVAWLALGVGPVLLAPLLGIRAYARRWVDRPGDRTGLLVLTVGTAVFGGLFLARSRFVVYALPFLFWWGALFLEDLLERARPGCRCLKVAAAVGALLFLLPSVQLLRPPFRPAFDDRLVDLLTWLRDREGPNEGVMAPWTLGHMIQYYADAPAVVSPFGTDVGTGGMRRLAAFHHAANPAEAEWVLRDARVGYVLLHDPPAELGDTIAFAPPGAVPLVSITEDYWGHGRSVAILPAYSRSPPGLLYERDGASPLDVDDRMDYVRLVYETAGPAPFKLFERVEGARVAISGAVPYEDVAAIVEVTTNQGRSFQWGTGGRADGGGRAVLRVPYATGPGGASIAGEYIALSGGLRRSFAVTDAAVRSAARIEVHLDPAPAFEGAQRSAEH